MPNTIIPAADPQDSVPPEITRLELLIASIVDVTKRRERSALEDCFGRVLERLTDATSLTIYQLQPQAGEVLVVPVLQWVGGRPVPASSMEEKSFLLASDAALAARLRVPYAAGVPPAAPGGMEKELILPLAGARGEICAYCRLENARNDADTQRVLPLLLDLYTNFLALLDDNERDTLTGLLSRKSFDRRISKILTTLHNQSKRAVDVSALLPFSLAVLDIDHFKHVNDTVGHVHGDEVLLLFANLMTRTFRDSDLLFRFGGEEFVVVLANADIVRARIALERFRRTVETNMFPLVGQITVSIGFASLSSDEMPRTTVDRADRALYFSKQHGRNQIQAYEDLVRRGLLVRQNIPPGEIELF